MFIIGVTGAIGAGKTTVADLLKEQGATVIDADQIARKVVTPGFPAWKKIVEEFGEEILQPNKELDRKKLSRIVFVDESKRRILNKIVHPEVISEIKRLLSEIELTYKNGKMVILDIPLLFEAELDKYCDFIIVVKASEEIRLKRLLDKGFDENDAKSRIEAQSEKEVFEEKADCVVDNSGSLERLKAVVESIIKKIKEEATSRNQP